MIFKCNWCRKEIAELRTPGDKECWDLICKKCDEEDLADQKRRGLEKPDQDPCTLIF